MSILQVILIALSIFVGAFFSIVSVISMFKIVQDLSKTITTKTFAKQKI